MRVIGIDIFRIALALLIFMFHSWMHFGCDYYFLTNFVSVGAIAMTGFFLLSGYTLRLVYGHQNIIEKHNLVQYYIKRILSILPLYYFASILYVIFLGKETFFDNIILFPIELFGLQSTFSSIFGITHNGGTWFISCILLAYLIYPFLQEVCKQMSLRFKVLLLLSLLLLDVWAPIVSNRFHAATLYDNPFYRILEFACGLIVADINVSYDNKILKKIRSLGGLIISVLILIIGVSIIQYFRDIQDYMLLNVLVLPSFILMLFPLGYIKIPILDKIQTISYLGKISYAFFLTQFFTWKVGEKVINCIGYDNNFLRIILTFSFCVIGSIFMYELIQKPIAKYVNKKLIDEL